MNQKKFNTVLANDKGEISFLGVLLILMTMSLSFLLVLKQLDSLKDFKERSNKHLCFKYLHIKTLNYLRNMAVANQTIQAGYTASLFPPTRPLGKSMESGGKLYQSLMHASYLKNIAFSKHCNLIEGFYFAKKLPYQMLGKLIFKRGPTGTALLKRKKWNITFLFYPIKLKEESIKVTYSVANAFSSPSSEISHKMKLDFSTFKPFFGRH